MLESDYPFQEVLFQQQPLSQAFIDVFNQGGIHDFRQPLVPRSDGFVYFDENSDLDIQNVQNVQKRKSVAPTKPATPQIKLKGQGKGRPRLTQGEKEERKKPPTQREEISAMKNMLELNLLTQGNTQFQIINGLQQLTTMSVPMDPALYIQQLNNTIVQQQATIQQMHAENFNLSMKYRQDECDLLAKYREEIESLRDVNRKAREKEEELLEKIKVLTAAKVEEHPVYEQLPLPPPRKQQLLPPSKTIDRYKKERLLGHIIKEEANTNEEGELYKWDTLKENNEKCVEIYGFSVQQIDTLVSIIKDLYKPVKSTRGAKKISDEWSQLLITLHYERYYQSLSHISEKFKHSKTNLYDIINTYTRQIGPILFKYTQDDRSVDDVDTVDRYYYQKHFIPINKLLDTQKALSYYDKERKSYGMYLHYIVDKHSGKASMYQVSTSATHAMSNMCGTETSNCSYNDRMIAKFMIMIIRFRGNLEDIECMCQLTLALCNYDVDCGNPILESPILEIEDL